MPKTHFILFDDEQRDHLLPLSATRAIADMRIGILTIKEKWEKYLYATVEVLTVPYLQPKYSCHPKENSIYINARVLPDATLVNDIKNLNEHTKLRSEDGQVIAIHSVAKLNIEEVLNYNEVYCQIIKLSNYQIKYPWHIFQHNGNEIRNDIALLELKPNPEKLSATNQLIGKEIYVEEGATCEFAILNSNDGPIYLGKDAEVMEGCTIRAPFALCEHATLKMQAKIYGDTTIGPHCKIGGEISNSVIFGYTNKAHDGFLGNSVLGEWCNLGADTNNSNLKNNYGKVKAYNYPAKDFINTGLQFCGLIMGDHSKAAINTQFNTGTVTGVFANIFNGDFPPKYIPDFAWGENAVFQLDKALEVAQRVMERRGLLLSDEDKAVIAYLYEQRTDTALT